MFSIGQYRDKIVKADDEIKFREKIVIIDAVSIDRPLAVPF